MNSADFNARVSLMGLTPQALSKIFDVQIRSIKAWCKDRVPPDEVADQVMEWYANFLNLVNEHVVSMLSAPEDADLQLRLTRSASSEDMFTPLTGACEGKTLPIGLWNASLFQAGIYMELSESERVEYFYGEDNEGA